MGKMQDDIQRAIQKMSLVDKQINQSAAAEDRTLQIGPEVNIRETLSPQEVAHLNSKYGRSFKIGMTRILKNENGIFRVHYRFDSLYLKTLTQHKGKVKEALKYFQNDFFLPLIMKEEKVLKFHPPLKIGYLPIILKKPILRTFFFSKNKQNSNRLECCLNPFCKKDLWIPIMGKDSFFGRHLGLLDSLSSIGAGI